VKRGAPLSLHVEHFIHCLRSEMQALRLEQDEPRTPASRVRKK